MKRFWGVYETWPTRLKPGANGKETIPFVAGKAFDAQARSTVVSVLTDSADPKAYWRQLKRRETGLVTNCHGLKLVSADGKLRVEDCAHVEGMLRN